MTSVEPIDFLIFSFIYPKRDLLQLACVSKGLNMRVNAYVFSFLQWSCKEHNEKLVHIKQLKAHLFQEEGIRVEYISGKNKRSAASALWRIDPRKAEPITCKLGGNAAMMREMQSVSASTVQILFDIALSLRSLPEGAWQEARQDLEAHPLREEVSSHLFNCKVGLVGAPKKGRKENSQKLSYYTFTSGHEEGLPVVERQSLFASKETIENLDKNGWLQLIRSRDRALHIYRYAQAKLAEAFPEIFS